MNRSHDIEELIGRYLTGEASAEEVQQVDSWSAQSAENQKLLDHFRAVYQRASLDDGHAYDADAAWIKVKARIDAGKTKSLIPPAVWQIAASIMLISVVAYLVYWNFLDFDRSTYISLENVSVYTMPDSTRVILNRNSTAEVIYHERKKSGIIKVSGEATISIRHTDETKWLVMVDDLLIRDIGTVFNVRALPEDERVEVTVTEGEVQFYTKTKSGIFIKAGESGLYNKGTQQFEKISASPNVMAYHTLAFTFNDADLKSVTDELSRVYNRKIVLTENLYACRITVDFNRENLETILDIITETLNLTFADYGNEIIITGEGCP
jgi:transmembrane sensor